MSLMNMILFGSIVLTIYGSVNFYILRRGWQSLSGHGPLRVFFLVVILFLILSYPLGRFLERPLRGLLTDFLVIVGSFYLALMIYFFLLILAVDFFRLLNAFLNFFPKAVTDNGPRAAFLAFWIVLALSLATVFLGYINASRLRFRDIEVTIAKPGGRYAGLRIVSASDIHFGTVLDGGRLRKIVDMINSAKPDLVLLPGDTLDEDVSENKAAELSRILKDVRAPLGVYAVLGNHEYYAGVEKSLAALRASGVTVLQDEAVKAGNSLILAGRKDRTALREREKRLSLELILAGSDRDLPLILLDHQPYHLEEAEKNGIDLQLSGHTHDGQLFPFDLLNKRLYEINWGTLRKGKTTVDVSCGAGTWGPPVRTAGRSEIIRIHVIFKTGLP
jgi:predicted MPP superfamily phosphohydrolase